MSAELHFISALQPLADMSATRWVYLGQNPATLKACSKILGDVGRVSTGERLDAIAHKVRPTFVSWVSLLAEKEPSASAFWDITFTARSPETSDLFPLLCLAVLGRELAQEQEEVTLLTDDPWLYECLRSNGVQGFSDLEAKKSRKSQKLKKLSRIPIARLSLLMRGLGRILASRTRFKLFRFSALDVLLVSYAYQKALEKKPYRDPFFGELSSRLQDWGFRPLHLFPLHTPAGLFAPIHKSTGLVLARWARLTDLLRTLTVSARLHEKAGLFADLDAEPLLKRELLFENATNRYALNRWQSLTWKRLAIAAPRQLIHIFENHPWEKGLNHAMRRTRRLGYQHTTVPELLMNYTPGGLKEDSFHPDIILANSSENLEYLAATGWPRSMLEFGGALRHSAQEALSPDAADIDNEARAATLYVALPGHAPLCVALLDALRDAAHLARLQRQQPLRILLKFHPSLSHQELLQDPIESATITDLPLSELKSEVDHVLFVSSTVGLEALLMGFSVSRFVPEGILTLNPVPGSLNEKVHVMSLATLPKLLTELSRRSDSITPLIQESKVIYSPFQPEIWKKVLSL